MAGAASLCLGVWCQMIMLMMLLSAGFQGLGQSVLRETLQRFQKTPWRSSAQSSAYSRVTVGFSSCPSAVTLDTALISLQMTHHLKAESREAGRDFRVSGLPLILTKVLHEGHITQTLAVTDRVSFIFMSCSPSFLTYFHGIIFVQLNDCKS